MALLSEKGFNSENAKGQSVIETISNSNSFLGSYITLNSTLKKEEEIIACFHNSFSISCFSLMHQVSCNIFLSTGFSQQSSKADQLGLKSTYKEGKKHALIKNRSRDEV